MTLRREVAEEIYQNLKTDVEFVLEDGTSLKEMVDMTLIIDGLNLIAEDPPSFFKTNMQALASLKILYTNLQEVTEAKERERDILVGSKRVQYSSSDEMVNPFAKTHKLTAAVVDALINEQSEVRALEDEISKAKDAKRRIWNLVEVVQKIYDVGKLLVEKVEHLPLSGHVVSQEDRAILEAEVAKLDLNKK